MTRRLCFALALATLPCFDAWEQTKDVTSDVVLNWSEGRYYLQHPGLDPALHGLGPSEELGWSGDVLVASVTRGGWRVIDGRTHAGWTRVLSREEAVEVVEAKSITLELVPIEDAWHRLR